MPLQLPQATTLHGKLKNGNIINLEPGSAVATRDEVSKQPLDGQFPSLEIDFFLNGMIKSVSMGILAALCTLLKSQIKSSMILRSCILSKEPLTLVFSYYHNTSHMALLQYT